MQLPMRSPKRSRLQTKTKTLVITNLELCAVGVSWLVSDFMLMVIISCNLNPYDLCI